ncbi:hypothetical protein [Luteibacter sp. 9133]|uniref:hypothetical protein n=1 Tax=Luteibacter sp. 9133 TaxID=1500891 RepID=UPI0012E0BE58|nr:hypothetical protein [Luteibacter sp. 9133]
MSSRRTPLVRVAAVKPKAFPDEPLARPLFNFRVYAINTLIVNKFDYFSSIFITIAARKNVLTGHSELPTSMSGTKGNDRIGEPSEPLRTKRRDRSAKPHLSLT